MQKMIYERIYDKLNKLLPLGSKGFKEGGDFVKLKSGSFMDLNIDFLHHKHPGVNAGTEEDCFIISMAHNYIQNGDVMADPDMEIAVFPKLKMAEALTYQQDGILEIFQRVYPEFGKVNPKLKKQLNIFLNQWLGNLKKQGFYK